MGGDHGERDGLRHRDIHRKYKVESGGNRPQVDAAAGVLGEGGASGEVHHVQRVVVWRIEASRGLPLGDDLSQLTGEPGANWPGGSEAVDDRQKPADIAAFLVGAREGRVRDAVLGSRVEVVAVHDALRDAVDAFHSEPRVVVVPAAIHVDVVNDGVLQHHRPETSRPLRRVEIVRKVAGSSWDNTAERQQRGEHQRKDRVTLHGERGRRTWHLRDLVLDHVRISFYWWRFWPVIALTSKGVR